MGPTSLAGPSLWRVARPMMRGRNESAFHLAAGPCILSESIRRRGIQGPTFTTLPLVHTDSGKRRGRTILSCADNQTASPTDRYQWRAPGNRRKMSTSDGSEAVGDLRKAGPGEQAPDRGNTALGKGFDLMQDDPGARKKIVIDGYDSHGFQLSDGVDVRGSMICFANSFVLWEPKRASDITIDSLKVLELVTPKIDIVIIGMGERMSERLDPTLMKHFRSKGIGIEQADTVNACSTFNVLNAEDRRVAAALLQLSHDDED